jgi:DNA-binding response OmpR family regulator
MTTAAVLVCDDDPIHRDLIRASLSPGGHRIYEVDDGDALAAAVDEVRPDIVILDLRMPTDGLDVLPALRSDAELAPVRVLVLSGATLPADRAAAYEAGADAFVAKPFSPRELAATVAELLARPATRTAAGLPAQRAIA